MEPDACMNCRFWNHREAEHRLHAHDYGLADTTAQCRETSPITYGDDRHDEFPYTSGSAWCGRYEPVQPADLDQTARLLALKVLKGDITAAKILADRVIELS